MTTAGCDLVSQVRVGRQAICDADRNVVAFALLFRVDDLGADVHLSEGAASEAIAATFGTFDMHRISNGRPIHANFTRPFLTGALSVPVASDEVVVRVASAITVDDELLSGLQRLRDSGYRIAVDAYRGDSRRAPLLPLANVVAFDVTDLVPETLRELTAAAVEAGAAPLATGIDSAEMFEQCRQVGIELFSGPYVQRPEVIEGRSLAPSQLICVRLMAELADPEVPMSRLEELVTSDPGLSMRLLRTASSASSGAHGSITSLRQALMRIGSRRLRSWVVMTLLEGGVSASPSDALWTVLARAHACQRLATDGEPAFTVGLMSGAAEIMGADPVGLADSSGVSGEIRDALAGGIGEPGRVLAAVLAHEHDDPVALAATGLAPFDVSRAYLEALNQSLSIVHSLLES